MATGNRDFTKFGLTNPPNGANPDPAHMFSWLADVQWVILNTIYERDKKGCHFGRVLLDTMERTSLHGAAHKAGMKTGIKLGIIVACLLGGAGAVKLIEVAAKVLGS